MKRVCYFIFDGMTDYEITLSMHLLGADAGYEVQTISYEASEIKSKSGVIYKPHKRVIDVQSEDVDGLIICGGWFGEVRPELTELIQRLDNEGKMLAGICGAGTFMLASAGVLKKRRYTTPITDWTEKHQAVFGLKNPFDYKTFERERVIRHDNVITSLGQAFIDFSIEICDWFKLFQDESEREAFGAYLKG